MLNRAGTYTIFGSRDERSGWTTATVLSCTKTNGCHRSFPAGVTVTAAHHYNGTSKATDRLTFSESAFNLLPLPPAINTAWYSCLFSVDILPTVREDSAGRGLGWWWVAARRTNLEYLILVDGNFNSVDSKKHWS